MKKALTSLELAALTNELQTLTNSKISQIYHQDDQFLFQLHNKEGKQLLRIIPGRFLNLTQTKKTPLKPSGLAMQLRKHLNNAFIRKIEQHDSERIIIFEIEKEEKYNLLIELFAPGNLILTNSDLQIIATLHQQKFRDRFIKPKEKYQFPASKINWKTITEAKLAQLLKKSEKKNLATSLATEFGLGGVYAEELCKLANLDKKQLPQQAPAKDIFLSLQQLLHLIKKPQGYLYPEQITPFPLQDQSPIKKTETYNQALDTIVTFEIASPYEKKIKTLTNTLNRQQEAIEKQKELIELNNQKAELVYNQYQPLNKLLQIVQNLKQTKTWAEIQTELQKEKKIKKINLKEKKIVIEL